MMTDLLVPCPGLVREVFGHAAALASVYVLIRGNSNLGDRSESRNEFAGD